MTDQTFLVPEGTHRERADKVLAAAHPEMSRAGWQRVFDAGLVRVQDRVIRCKQSVSAGDVLTYSIPDVKPATLKAVDIPLDVLYEDKHLLALNKASGMIVHPGAGTGEDTLVHALLAHCEGELSGIGGVERPGIVHRLDRETSGVMLVAKTDEAHRGLSTQFHERALHKEYLALVDGVPRLLSGSVNKPIGRHPQHRHKMAVVEGTTGGRDAHTDWEVVESFGKTASLIRCVIHTGRTHQIRVHLKYLGHILLGDVIYGWKPNPDLPVAPERVMLHAAHLIVTHPITGETMDLQAPLPPDFAKLLAALREAMPRVPTQEQREAATWKKSQSTARAKVAAEAKVLADEAKELRAKKRSQKKAATVRASARDKAKTARLAKAKAKAKAKVTAKRVKSSLRPKAKAKPTKRVQTKAPLPVAKRGATSAPKPASARKSAKATAAAKGVTNSKSRLSSQKVKASRGGPVAKVKAKARSQGLGQSLLSRISALARGKKR